MNKNNWITFNGNESCISFIKKYSLRDNVKKAEISITTMGWFNLFINSLRIDKTALTPGWTSYLKRIQYMTYDITNSITDNILDLKVDVGNGWANATRLACGKRIIETSYFKKSLIYEITIEYSDGTKELLTSDEQVDVYTNEIVFNEIYDGEIQDQFRKIELLGKASYIKIDSELIPQYGEDIIYAERIPAKDLFIDSNGDIVIDFGQNFAGNIEINIDANDNETISFVPGEVLDANGAFYNENYRSAKSFFSFKLSKDKRIYIARFSFLGGRYIKLIDYPKNIQKENFTAVLIHSKMEKTSTFECGNKDLQRLYLNSVYGQLGNYIDVPTDCPQRDERLGWTADTQVFSSTAAIHFNVDKFLNKWVDDLILSQHDDGNVPGIVPPLPYCGWEAFSTGWGDAITVVPYEMYKAYKDVNILKKSIKAMQKWVDFELSHFKKQYIVQLDFSYADWCALDKVFDGNFQGATRYDLVDTAYTAYSLSNLIKSMEVLGIDSTKYKSILEKMKIAYQNEFIKDGHMIGPRALIFSNLKDTANTQTGIIFSLCFDLCKHEDRESLLNDLVENIKDCGTRLTTGFLGTPLLLHALSDNGRSDIAYDLLLQTKYPSWLYSVRKGATTFWEHYDGIKEDGSLYDSNMNSYNHYAYGSVFNWMFKNMAGINNVGSGYDEILIKPLIDKRVGYVNCTFKSMYGEIYSSWKYLTDHKILFNIKVPNKINTTIILPDRKTYKTNNGGCFEYLMSL